MNAFAPRQPRRLLARGTLVAIVVAAVAVAMLGGALVPGAIFGHDSGTSIPQTAAVASTYAVGVAAPTSFGTLRVLEARPVTGLTNAQLGNMSHGISGLIDARDAQMEVEVELTNSTGSAQTWNAEDFRLATGGEEHMYAAIGGTRESGSLSPGATVDLGLNFVVPRDGAQLALRVRDRDHYVRVHVGRVKRAPKGTVGVLHDH